MGERGRGRERRGGRVSRGDLEDDLAREVEDHDRRVREFRIKGSVFKV